MKKTSAMIFVFFLLGSLHQLQAQCSEKNYVYWFSKDGVDFYKKTVRDYGETYNSKLLLRIKNNNGVKKDIKFDKLEWTSYGNTKIESGEIIHLRPNEDMCGELSGLWYIIPEEFRGKNPSFVFKSLRVVNNAWNE
jgi:hypothetical protein